MKVAGLAKELFELSKQGDEIEKKRTKLRKSFFNIATDRNRYEPKAILPMKSVVVPKSFFEKVGMTTDEFLESRYPSWHLTAKSTEEDHVVFIMVKDPQYLPYEYVDEETNIKISKQIREPTPEVDWDSLEKEDPELCFKLRKPVIKFELDEEVFSKLSEEDPEVVAILQRHLVVKMPSEALAKPTIVKDEEDE